MNVSSEHLIQQARERFALQDYRGAAFLLEEVVAGGRAFADVHHLLGVSYSLLSLPTRALEEFDRALALNPRYIEALIHRGMILMDLGRREEAEASFQHAQQGDLLTAGLPAHAAGRLANLHAGLAEAYAELGALEPAIEQLTIATEAGSEVPGPPVSAGPAAAGGGTDAGGTGRTGAGRPDATQFSRRARPARTRPLPLRRCRGCGSGLAGLPDPSAGGCAGRGVPGHAEPRRPMMLGVRWGSAAVLLALMACGPSGGPEGQGDQAYVEGRYQDALAVYAPLAATTPSPQLWAKIGATALRLGQLREATDAYRALAEAAPDRTDEAAEGLELVISAAERRQDESALEEAVAALRAVAPERPLGRHALNLMQVASGPVTRLRFCRRARRRGGRAHRGFAPASPGVCVWRGRGIAPRRCRCTRPRSGGRGARAIRRPRRVWWSASSGWGQPSSPRRPDSAEAWFRSAAGIDSTTPLGRSAMIGLGDARLRQGDLVGAAIAYQTVLSSGPRSDSLSMLAGAKLNALVSADAPDSLSTGLP